MVAQDGEHVVQELLLRLHGGQDGPHLHRGPLHALQGHAVVRLPLGLAELEGLDVEDHRLGLLIAQGVLQQVVGLPDVLLRAAPDVAVDAVLLPEDGGGKVLVDLAVSHEDHVVVLDFLVILGHKGSLHHAVHIFRHQQALEKKQAPQDDQDRYDNFQCSLHGCAPNHTISR